jgi:DNA-binding response OmpR family regulator
MNTMNAVNTIAAPTQREVKAPRQRRILIIDDEISFTRLLKLNLDQTGRYLGQTENDPQQALSTALCFRPDLILMDVMMHHTDGGDLARLFQEIPALKRIPIIFLTATVLRSEVRRYDGHFGGYEFMAKPLDMQELLEGLDAHFGPNIRREINTPVPPTP